MRHSPFLAGCLGVPLTDDDGNWSGLEERGGRFGVDMMLTVTGSE